MQEVILCSMRGVILRRLRACIGWRKPETRRMVREFQRGIVIAPQPDVENIGGPKVRICLDGRCKNIRDTEIWQRREGARGPEIVLCRRCAGSTRSSRCRSYAEVRSRLAVT